VHRRQPRAALRQSSASSVKTTVCATASRHASSRGGGRASVSAHLALRPLRMRARGARRAGAEKLTGGRAMVQRGRHETARALSHLHIGGGFGRCGERFHGVPHDRYSHRLRNDFRITKEVTCIVPADAFQLMACRVHLARGGKKPYSCTWGATLLSARPGGTLVTAVSSSWVCRW